MNTLQKLAPRLLAGFGTLTLLAGIGLFASHPAHSGGGPVPVTVTNSLNVQNHDADNAARQPFQTTLFPYSITGYTASDSFTVPAHKRLVIEFVSSDINVIPSGGGYSFLETTVGGYTNVYDLTSSFDLPSRRTQVVRVYADPGTTVKVGANSYSGAGIGTDTELSGYYVDVP